MTRQKTKKLDELQVLEVRVSAVEDVVRDLQAIIKKMGKKEAKLVDFMR